MKYSKILFYSFTGLILTGLVYFNSNTGSFYIMAGNFYYRQSNIKKAQHFYEKAFTLGNNSSVIREIYANSIMNSPLTVESQEKLENLAEGKIQDGIAVKSKYFLYELMREIHRQYPLNYVKQAPFNGKIVRWGKYPVTYSFRNKHDIPQDYVEEINKAFLQWEKQGGIMFEENQKHPNIVINVVKQLPDKPFERGKKYVAASTVPQVSGNILQRMDINFYLNDPEGNLFTPNQIYNTALHEIFHALGFMGHSYDAESIMYLAKDNKTLINDSRKTLTEADISTLKLLYKIKPDITNSDELKSEYIPYLILGDDEDINSSKAREAKNYIYHAPTLPGGYIDLAESQVAQKKYVAAIKSLEKALRVADNDEMRYIIYYNTAIAYFYESHTEMALEYIQNAMEIKDTEELHLLKAEVLRKEHKEESKKEYEYLVNVAPDKVEYVTSLANLYIMDYNYLRARKLLKGYLKRNPAMKNNEHFSPYGILIW